MLSNFKRGEGGSLQGHGNAPSRLRTGSSSRVLTSHISGTAGLTWLGDEPGESIVFKLKLEIEHLRDHDC